MKVQTLQKLTPIKNDFKSPGKVLGKKLLDKRGNLSKMRQFDINTVDDTNKGEALGFQNVLNET